MKRRELALWRVAKFLLIAVICVTSSAAAQEGKALQLLSPSIETSGKLEEIRKKYPQLQEKPFGKGVYAHVRKAGGKVSESRERIVAWAENPYIAGSQLSYTWAELEPREGQYRWDVIERDLEPWAKAGKKCWIEISTVNWRDRSGSRVTPGWLFDKGVAGVQRANTARYPVFWDAKYIELWGNFIQASARKFDGDPRIEFLSTGGYSSGHEPNLSSRDNDALTDQWKKAGFDGFNPSGVYLNRAIKPILKIYSSAFQRTPVAQTVHVRTDFDRAMNEYAAGLKFILISNGLSWKMDAQSRQAWRERREKLGVKTGFAEWGPAGRETDLEKLREKRQRKRATREGQQMDRSKSAIDWSTVATLMDVYHSAIGEDGNAKLKPRSRISYLPLGRQFPEVESEGEWRAALKWAWEQLEG